MQINQSLSTLIEKVTGKINSILPVGGGSINNSFKLKTTQSSYFLKTNGATISKEMFKTESIGLGILRSHSQFKIPEVIMAGGIPGSEFLLLEWIEPGLTTPESYEKAGTLLAEMHQSSNPFYGLNHDNFIGPLVQSNRQHQKWTSFFIEERLEPQLQLCKAKKAFGPSVYGKFEKLYNQLDEIFPVEPPALLHGDLWSGNFMVTQMGFPTIFDPAIYFGHREMDLAMTTLFGGFTQPFYHAYHNVYPLNNGWKERLEICNLYPLLVHVNLFGGAYTNQVEEILYKF